MRIAVFLTLGLLCACASEKLALVPPAGVDFSGRWRLNDAESDDPMRLVTSQIDPSRVGTGQGGQGGQGRGRRGGGPGGGMGGVGGPVMPGVDTLGDGLRWPGKDIEIKQVAGAVALSSGGVNQLYQPRSVDAKPRRHKARDDGQGGRDMRDRDMPARDRGEGPPAVCGWENRTLVVQGGEADDERAPYEQRYSVSEDGQRLVEVISFKGGRSGGFTMSRTWDRVAP